MSPRVVEAVSAAAVRFLRDETVFGARILDTTQIRRLIASCFAVDVTISTLQRITTATLNVSTRLRFHPYFLRRRKPAITFQENPTKGASTYG
jgi:hypothetical protein